jgi:hypothetical protein
MSAREEQAQYIEDQTEGFDLYPRKGAWKQKLAGHRPGQRGLHQRRNDPDAMDVNLAHVGNMTDEKKKKLAAEGRCFFCK